MEKITELDIKNKTVLLRCDFNVTIKDGVILSDERIKASLKTIKYILSQNCRLIILSHLGKVKTKEDKSKNTLFPVYTRLCELLDTNIYFSSATRGEILETKVDNLGYGEILLVENTRYEDLDDKKESKCSQELSKYWSTLADVFVCDAFAMTHRQHASNYGIEKYLPSARGFLIDEEVEGLKRIINPERPFLIIMGGAKVEDKLDIIKGLLPKCDKLIVGGGIANSFLNVNYNVGLSLKDDSKKEELKELLDQYEDKIILPVDFKVLNNGNIYERKLDELTAEDNILDIGKETTNIYIERINEASTIFLNGTVGKYEEAGFEEGTKNILNAIANSKAVSVIGGGDAISSAEYFKEKNFDFISTGGGATLEYLSTGKLKSEEEQ